MKTRDVDVNAVVMRGPLLCVLLSGLATQPCMAQGNASGGSGSTSGSPTIQTPTAGSTGTRNRQQPNQLPATTNEPNAQGLPAGKPRTFEIHGAFFERYRDDTNKYNGNRSAKSSVTYGNVRLMYNFDSHFEGYVRYGFELISPYGTGRDFNTNYYNSYKNWAGANAFDQYGLIFRSTDRRTIVNVGRQDEPLDASSTLYDLSYRVGLHTFLDGVSVVHLSGASTIQAYAFSEDQYRKSSTRNGLYAARGTYSVSNRTTLGATVGHFQSSAQNQAAGVASTDNYEADVVQKFGALQLTAEYGQSSARSRHELYYFGGNYKLTSRDKLTAFTYRIDQNADMGEDTSYVNNYRGERYFWEHFYTPTFETILYYEADHACYGPAMSNSFQITGQYTF